MSDRLVQLLDISQGYTSAKDGTLLHNLKTVDRGEMGYFPAPMEFPAYVRFWRRVTRTVNKSSKGSSGAHLGTTMEVDVFQFGIKLYVRWDMAHTNGGKAVLKIILEDEDGMNTIASYER